jgi:serine/threonine protein kinase
MIIYGSYYGDKADVWSSGCILLELLAGHEKFCDVWMTAYDYEILQNKDHFSQTIQETVDTLPSVLNFLDFSPELNNFILQFLDLRTNRRPHMDALCADPWLDGLINGELASRREKLAETGATSSQTSSLFPKPPSPSMPSMTRTNSQSSVEMVFSNFSERERHHMEQYILHHKDDSPDNSHAQMHLPPIVPATPNISGAKKIFDKGSEEV